jgi:hypothetical protein
VSRVAWLRPIIDRYPSFQNLVLNSDPLAPALWVEDENGWQRVDDPAALTTLGNAFSASLSDDENATYTSTGVLVHREALDGVGQVTVRHVRGASGRTTIVTMTPIQMEGDLSTWKLDAGVVNTLGARGAGLVLVGGTTKLAAELARAIFTLVTTEQVDTAAAVIGPEPVARAIARTPWVWIACDPRQGVTDAEDAADSIAGVAQIVLLDVGGESAAVNAAIRLVDAGALVIANVNGNDVRGILERWEAAASGTSREKWIATVASLRAAFAVEAVSGRYGQELVTEYITVDATARTTLAREGPIGVIALLAAPGARSRDTVFAELRSIGRL